jgi:antitoxin PrlF
MPIEETCTITAKGQTTIPKAVRQALGIDYGSRIAFRIENGAVTVHAADATGSDPALAPFLALLAREIETPPDTIAPLPPDLIARIQRLTGDVVVDHDAAIEGDGGL